MADTYSNKKLMEDSLVRGSFSQQITSFYLLNWFCDSKMKQDVAQNVSNRIAKPKQKFVEIQQALAKGGK